MQSRTRNRCAALVLGFLVVALAGRSQAQEYEYDRSADAVVVSYLERLDGLADADPGPSITLYGDGRVLIHTPRYMKNAGDRVVRLSRKELDSFIAGLVADGVLTIDTAALAEPEATASGGGGSLSGLTPPRYISHESTTVLEVNVRRAGSRSRGAQRFAARGLERRAREEPQAAAVQSFRAAELRVRGLRSSGGTNPNP